jgi:hypothetical protein
MSPITVKQIIAEDHSACAIIGYEYINRQGEKLEQNLAEVWVMQVGKLNSYFCAPYMASSIPAVGFVTLSLFKSTIILIFYL